jgi:hypothetical protein
MKYFKNIKVSSEFFLSLCLILLISFSCSKSEKSLNYDQKLITDEQLEMDANGGGFLLPTMQLSIISPYEGNYEGQIILHCDDYAGYVREPYPDLNNVNNSTYGMVDGWNNNVWSVPASGVLDNWIAMKKKGFDTKYSDLFALATIFKVFVGHRLVDVFGPIPYSLYGTASDVKFDSGEEAYNLFFTELSNAVDTLKKAEAANPAADLIRYAKFDKSRYGGDYAKWIKVANTLRLRLAIRIANVNPTKAKAEAEAAVNDSYGVLTSSDGTLEVTSGNQHPLVAITESWRDTGLNAAMESILNGFKDPRLPVYAKPSSLEGDSIKGIRSGALMDVGSAEYLKFSVLNFDGIYYVKLIDVSESYFLRAEGVLRGWNMGGTAKDFYEEGIRLSFKSNGVSGVESYLNDNTSTQKTYVDPINPLNNAKPLSSSTVKWDENATMQQKLERIIVQKWIAIYPDGGEAWAEFRRTGYPKLWPVVLNYSGGIVPDGQFIKRLSYPTAITNSSQSAVTEAVNSYLDGKDNIYQRIWWDVN